MLPRSNSIYLILAVVIVAATVYMAVTLADFGESPLFVLIGPALIVALLLMRWTRGRAER